MPHFKDQSEAKVGDRCIFQSGGYDQDGKWNPKMTREGLIFDINPGAASCNAQVAYPLLENSPNGTSKLVRLTYAWVTLGDCERAGGA